MDATQQWQMSQEVACAPPQFAYAYPAPQPIVQVGNFPCNVASGAWSMGGYLQPMQFTQNSDTVPQIIGFMPIYSADPSMPPPLLHDTASWQQVQPCTSLNFAAPQMALAMAPYPSDQSGQADCDHPPSTHSADSSLPETYYLSTPELTPRYSFATTPEVDVRPCLDLQLSLQVGLQPYLLKDATSDQHVEPDVMEMEPDSSDDEFDLPEGNPADRIIEGEWHRCWDLIPRDSLSYASSDTSTSVSRSARRRRGRRSAKAKASRSSMPILESPPANDLLVVEEKKVELMQMLELGGDQMRKAVLSLHGSVFRMSMEPLGCRVVQKALDVASSAEKERLVLELHDHVRLAIASPHANFVLQKVIEVLPVHAASFVAEELATVAAEVARHRFGCRVLSRLIEHHLCGNATSPATNNLIDELLSEADLLINHNFARHVLELILEHGNDVQKQKIVKIVMNNLFVFAKNRNASYVVEKVMALCKPADTHAIASELLTDTQCFLMLAMHECGTHVVKAIMQSHADCAGRAKQMLLTDADLVKSSKYGKRLLDEM